MILFPDITSEKIQPAIKPNQRVKRRVVWGSGKETHRQGWKRLWVASKAVPPVGAAWGTTPPLGFRPDAGHNSVWGAAWYQVCGEKKPQDQKKAKDFQCPKKPARAT